MANESIHRLIDQLNGKNRNSLIQCRPLSEGVDFAFVWQDAPKPTDRICSNDGPYQMYFIKSEDRYIAAVLDMYMDLHWYVVPNFRRKGHLTRAMRATILPHLFLNRDRQRVTISRGMGRFEESEWVAKRLGFQLLLEGDLPIYELSRTEQHRNLATKGSDVEFSEEQVQRLRQEIHYCSRKLRSIQTELEAAYGPISIVEETQDLAKQVRNLASDLDTVWWSRRKKGSNSH